jgi:hypothetical protein
MALRFRALSTLLTRSSTSSPIKLDGEWNTEHHVKHSSILVKLPSYIHTIGWQRWFAAPNQPVRYFSSSDLDIPSVEKNESFNFSNDRCGGNKMDFFCFSEWLLEPPGGQEAVWNCSIGQRANDLGQDLLLLPTWAYLRMESSWRELDRGSCPLFLWILR